MNHETIEEKLRPLYLELKAKVSPTEEYLFPMMDRWYHKLIDEVKRLTNDTKDRP